MELRDETRAYQTGYRHGFGAERGARKPLPEGTQGGDYIIGYHDGQMDAAHAERDADLAEAKPPQVWATLRGF